MSLTKFADSNLKTRFVKEVLQKSYVPILNTKENLGSTYKTIDKYSEPHETFDESWVGKNVIIENAGIRKYGEVISYESSIDGSFIAIIETNELDEQGKFIKIEITNDNISDYSFHKPEPPYIYQQVEYIESTGTQYIDTGVKGDQNFGFDIKFVKLSELSTVLPNFGCIFGARTGTHKNELELSTYSPVIQGVLFNGIVRWDSTNVNYNAYLIDDKTSIQTASLRNREYVSPQGDTYTLDNITFATPVNIILFGINTNGEVSQQSKVRLYSFKMYDTNTLIRNFVPVYNTVSNEIGLYDKVENLFYSNQGTGTFTKGSDVPNI